MSAPGNQPSFSGAVPNFANTLNGGDNHNGDPVAIRTHAMAVATFAGITGPTSGRIIKSKLDVAHYFLIPRTPNRSILHKPGPPSPSEEKLYDET